MILTSKWHAEHSFAGQNTQHSVLEMATKKTVGLLKIQENSSYSKR